MLQFGYLNRHSSNFLSVRQPHLSRVSSPVSWSMMRTQSFVCAVSALPWKIVISTVHSSGNHFSWSGNLCPWSGNHFSWAGNLCSWIRNLCSGSGNLCSWSGNYFSWAGNLCSWFRNLSSWSGNFCSWSGNYFSWARNLCSWFRNFCPWSGSLNLYLKSFNNQDTFDHNPETFSDILGAYNPFFYSPDQETSTPDLEMSVPHIKTCYLDQETFVPHLGISVPYLYSFTADL